MNLIYNPISLERDQAFLADKLFNYNRACIQDYGYESFCFKYADSSDAMVAGIDCQAGGGWLYIVSLWVARDERTNNLDTKLLRAAEQKGVEKGCHSAYLYTYSFQSSVFYEKHGYFVFGQLEGFCGEHRKVFMQKPLV